MRAAVPKPVVQAVCSLLKRSIVLKGIPTDIPTEEVKEELETLGFCVKFIRRFGTPDKPMPLCLVHITSSEIAKDIFLLTSLFYIQISVEPLKSDGPAQCFSCQRFGHGSRNCGHPLRCVKCAANFRGCPQYLAQIQPKSVTPSPTNPKLNCPRSIHTNAKPNLTLQQTPPPPLPAPKPTMSYANATAGTAPPPPLPKPHKSIYP
ncbi:hypothetical protein QTP88_005502 [Uroleucon formosanum]